MIFNRNKEICSIENMVYEGKIIKKLYNILFGFIYVL